jgi:hypothetical protein
MANVFSQIRIGQAVLADEVARRWTPGLTGFPPAFVGRVFVQSSLPSSAGRYFAVHPVSILGTEGEGNPAVLEVDTSSVILVYVLGPSAPSVGDDLICRFVGSRWIAERMSGRGATSVNLPGCLCAATPSILFMTCTDSSCNGGIFQNCTLAYGPTPSGYAALALGDSCFLSTESFQDQTTGDYFQYYFTCNSSYYTLSRVYLTSVLGSPYQDIVRYSWLIGLAGNTCQPFLMSNGQIFQGGDPNCVVTISQ